MIVETCDVCTRCNCLMALGLDVCPTCGDIQRPAHYSMTNGQVGRLASDAILKTLWENDAAHGSKWKRITDDEDVEHIIAHLNNHLAGDTSEPHIEHALTRVAFILARKAS